MRASKGHSCALQVLLRSNRCACACAKGLVPASLVSPALGEFLGAPRANYLRLRTIGAGAPGGGSRGGPQIEICGPNTHPTTSQVRVNTGAIQWGDPFAPPSREVWQRGTSLLFAHAHTPRCEATLRVLGGAPKHCSSQAWQTSAATRTHGPIAAMDACNSTAPLRSPGRRTKNRLQARL